jgi:methyl coenzyme M reductase subunit D
MNAPRTLAALFKEAAGDRDSIEIGGRKIEFEAMSGSILVDRQYLDEIPVETIADVAEGLKEAASSRFVDPESAPDDLKPK